MVSKELQGLLEGLDLLANKGVFFSNKEDGRTYVFGSEFQKKIDVIKPDAFFVFNNQPYILFFDLTKGERVEREDKIHKQVWSFDYSPLVFVVKHNEIEIFNAFNYDKKRNRLQSINLTESERNENFSFWKLQSGESWKWLQANHYKNTIQKKRVNQRLFDNIKEVREKLTDKANADYLEEDEANILILRLIFIRYLIDREVKIDSDYITGDTILAQRKSFAEIIEKPRKLNELFNYLNERFNGVLFKNTNTSISKFQAVSLSSIFSGGQSAIPTLFDDSPDFYFDIFDFSIIPVEVISGIYESLISPETRNEHSAVYTPAFLVDYILTETVDKFLQKHQVSECKIFDPACGSGIFLVQSLRRMIDKEIELADTKVPNKKFSERIREIAKENLFGIDINRQALKVTCFSVYIALLDYQKPKDIDKYEFPNFIDENFFEADFFETDSKHSLNTVIKLENFDFILGNPPWKSNKGEKHLAWLKGNNKVTGRYEIAQSFLLRTKDFMQPNTVASLIVTSTIFYNISTTTQEFKNEFLTEYCLDRFIDLSPVRRLIFEEKNSPASIVYYRLSDGKKHLTNVVSHLSIKSNMFLKYFKTLIVEKFDNKEIQQKHFLDNEWMFKVALYGNTLDFAFLKRLLSDKNSKKIEELIDNKSIFKGDGILKGTPKAEPFSFLEGLPVIENSEVKPYYTKVPMNSKRLKRADTFLESGRRIELFKGQHIYLKAQTLDESHIVISYCKETVVNKHDVITITSETKVGKLKEIYAKLISDLFTYYQFMTSSAWGVSTRPAVRLEEYFSFPSKNIELKHQSSLLELVNQFLQTLENHYSGLLRSQELPINRNILDLINDIINSTYGVKEFEKDLIDFVLNVSRYQFQESKQHNFTKRVETNIEFLKCYASVFLKEFADLYDDEFLQVVVYPLNTFIAMNFVFLDKKPSSKDKIVFKTDTSSESEILKRIAGNLTISKITNSKDVTKNIYIQKDIKGFEPNSFYIIKPNEFKCWHRAMAWYDAAEIKEKIERAELTYLNESNVK